jgi:hypothetical protein
MARGGPIRHARKAIPVALITGIDGRTAGLSTRRE